MGEKAKSGESNLTQSDKSLFTFSFVHDFLEYVPPETSCAWSLSLYVASSKAA